MKKNIFLLTLFLSFSPQAITKHETLIAVNLDSVHKQIIDPVHKQIKKLEEIVNKINDIDKALQNKIPMFFLSASAAGVFLVSGSYFCHSTYQLYNKNNESKNKNLDYVDCTYPLASLSVAVASCLLVIYSATLTQPH